MIIPNITSVTISSNNATNTLAKPNDVITLAITSDEDITAPTVTFSSGGSAVTNNVNVTGSGQSYTATYTVNENDIDGLCSFAITNYTDLTGNAGNGVTSVTDTSEITVDNKSCCKNVNHESNINICWTIYNIHYNIY